MELNGPINEVNPIIFDDIDAELVCKMSLKTKDAAGPSSFDADDWRSILGTRIYGDTSDDLCKAISNMTKKLCIEEVTGNRGGISALVACRVIPLDKDPGLRPIGIGEVSRRIIGKWSFMSSNQNYKKEPANFKCVWANRVCEAGVHAMYDLYQDEDSHGIIQIDANNAFNVINRNVFLHNIQILCTMISTFVRNWYLKPARLFVLGGVEIPSAEGTTQGDPTAMPT